MLKEKLLADLGGEMTRVTWGNTGSRIYQGGIDQGMFYTGTDIPVAVTWSGLISVTEAPDSGDPQSFFLDGQKILNIPSGEDFKGTIEAFSAPEEFYPCAGRNRMSTGLFAADQPRQVFGFSYRTLIGNDISGNNYAYKIHVVYNALAQFSGFSRQTITDTTSATPYSWDITTSPVSAAGIRPTAHVIFDTRKVSSDNMDALEDILYGNASDAPRLPDISELLTLLSS